MTRLPTLRFTLPRHDLLVAKPLPIPKHTDALYSTPAYRVWRRDVVRQANGKCEWVEPNGSLCGAAQLRMYADHVVEVRDGGAQFDRSNGQCLCAKHHTIKTNLVKKNRQAFQQSTLPKG